ncbi:ArsR/SmtB family transcription factor [Tissierella carlieri]|uniref:ArsR/SmtB family transcription factor n=1 Tax=Tissierella carlieri TaxID=689904 RepID=UPI003867B017
MKFKFYPTESRIYDFLEFPNLIFVKERYENLKEDYDYEKFPMDDYFDLINKVEDKLKPYIKEIELFYMKNFVGDYDFIGLISKTKRIFGYENEKKYLEMLSTLNEKDINQCIAYSIISRNENNHQYSDEIMSKAETISLNKNELVSIIKDLPIEASTKWTLFLIVEEPIKYMKIYIDLMNKLLPIFEEIYSLYENEVKAYGQYLVDFLNKNGAKGLEEITYSIIDPKIMNNEENNILISLIMPMAIAISDVGKYHYVAWGLKMEKAFRKMKEINENKINGRIQVFKNLGDKTRYEVLKLISSGETSTKEIANTLGVSSATISYHINNLLQAKVIKLDRIDNKYGYVVDYELLDKVIKDFKEDLMFPKES